MEVISAVDDGNFKPTDKGELLNDSEPWANDNNSVQFYYELMF